MIALDLYRICQQAFFMPEAACKFCLDSFNQYLHLIKKLCSYLSRSVIYRKTNKKLTIL